MKMFRVQTKSDTTKHIIADAIAVLANGHLQLVRHVNVQTGLGDGWMSIQTIHEVVIDVGPDNLLSCEIVKDDIDVLALDQSQQPGPQTPKSKQAPTRLRAVLTWKLTLDSTPEPGVRVLVKDEDGFMWVARIARLEGAGNRWLDDADRELRLAVHMWRPLE